MAEILIPLAISAATTGISYGAQALLTKKVKPTPVDRGRLDDVRFSAPGFGAALIRGYGTYRVAPVWFWDTEPVDHPVTTPGSSGGKGGGGAPPTPDTTNHYYTKSLAGAIGDKLLYVGVSRIWFNADLVYNADVTTNLADTSSTRYEAEHGILAGGASVATGAQYSNGVKVTGIGSGGSVTVHVDVDTTGTYEMAVAYTAVSQKTFKVSVNGGLNVDLVCASSGGSGNVSVEVMNVFLTAGANTIAFSNSGASAPDLDCISLAPRISFVGPNTEDRRSFTGLIDPNRGVPSNPDTFWPVADERAVFSDGVGGTAGGGFYTATLSQWGNPTIRIYPGSEDQPQDPAIIADKGIDNAPAYRGTPYMVIDTLQITAQRPLPNVTVEVQQGMREVAPIVTDLYEEVGVPAAKLDLTQIGGLVIGDSEGFNPGTYTGISWSGTSNATGAAGGAIHKTSGTTNTWNSYADAGQSITAGTDVSIRFTADAGTFLIGFSTSATPSGSLPHPYDQVKFGVLLNLNSKPSQALKNAIQMSLGGSSNSNDVGAWARLDQFQIEIRNGRGAAYQNGLLLGGFPIPVLTYPLRIVFAGYATGGGAVEASFATGSNIGSEPIVANGGGLVSPQQVEAAELIMDLQTRFQFDMVEVDGVVRAILRDQDAADLVIPEDKLRAHRKGQQRPVAAVTISDKNPIDIPRTVEVNFLNPQLDFHNDTADDGQLIGGPQRGVTPISLNLIETRQNMKNLAVLLRHKARMEAREYKFQTGPEYIKAHRGTRIDLQMNDGKVYKTRVDTMTSDLPLGVIEFVAKRHNADVFSPTSSGFNLGLEAPIVPTPGNTKGVFIDAPLVEPESSSPTEQPVQYIAMCGRGSGTWPGSFLLKEFPLGSGVYEIVAQTDQQATIGIATNALAAWTDPETKDTTSSLTIDLYMDGQLESVTDPELQANGKLNLLAVKCLSTGETEYLQFQTATLVSTDVPPLVKRYTVSNFYRGRNETIGAASSHSIGDEVVLMNSAVKVLVMATALLTVSCNYKFLTVGQDQDNAQVVTNIWKGFSLKPFSPDSLLANKDTSKDWRISAVGNPRDSERPESYIARIRRASTGVVMRDIPIVPGIRMAAIFGNVIHDFPSGTWSTDTYADTVNNNVIGQTDETAVYVTQPFTVGGEINARVVVTPAPAPYLTGVARLGFGPSDFTNPFSSITGAIFSTKDDNSTTLTHIEVFNWSTTSFTSFDLATVDGVVFVRVVWSGTELRWQFSGSPINPAQTPNVVLKDVAPTDPTFLRVSLRNGGPLGASECKVENVTIGGLSTPQTVYSLAQQENDNGGNEIMVGDLDVELWQVSKYLPDFKGFSTRKVF